MKTKLFALLLITACVSMTSAIAAGHNRNTMNGNNNNQDKIARENRILPGLPAPGGLNLPRTQNFLDDPANVVFIPANYYRSELTYEQNLENYRNMLRNNNGQ